MSLAANIFKRVTFQVPLLSYMHISLESVIYCVTSKRPWKRESASQRSFQLIYMNLKKINMLNLFARTNKKFGNVIIFRKLKQNYLNQRANSEHGNRFPDEEKSLIVSNYHDRV